MTVLKSFKQYLTAYMVTHFIVFFKIYYYLQQFCFVLLLSERMYFLWEYGQKIYKVGSLKKAH